MRKLLLLSLIFLISNITAQTLDNCKLNYTKAVLTDTVILSDGTILPPGTILNVKALSKEKYSLRGWTLNKVLISYKNKNIWLFPDIMFFFNPQNILTQIQSQGKIFKIIIAEPLFSLSNGKPQLWIIQNAQNKKFYLAKIKKWSGKNFGVNIYDYFYLINGQNITYSIEKKWTEKHLLEFALLLKKNDDTYKARLTLIPSYDFFKAYFFVD